MNLKDGLELVWKVRKGANPNTGFTNQLIKIEENELGVNSNLSDLIRER